MDQSIRSCGGPKAPPKRLRPLVLGGDPGRCFDLFGIPWIGKKDLKRILGKQENLGGWRG